MFEIKKYVNERIVNLILQEQYESLSDFLYNIKNYSILKGSVLSNYCYKNHFGRGIGDIDILINRNQIPLLEQSLINFGFETIYKSSDNSRFDKIFLLSSSHQLMPYTKRLKHSRIKIDINFDIFWGEYEGKRIDINEFLSDTIEMDIYRVKVKTLPPLKAMIHLILHHYKDMNSIYLLATRKSIKYDMFKDVYYLWKNNQDDISLDKLYVISSEYEIIPYVFYVLYYTNEIFKDAKLENYVNSFRTQEGETLLNCYGLCDKERKEWKYDFQTRLEADNLYDLIKDDLTEKDKEKIKINKRVFMGVTK